MYGTTVLAFVNFLLDLFLERIKYNSFLREYYVLVQGGVKASCSNGGW